MASLWHIRRAEEGLNHRYGGKLDGPLAGRGGEPAIAAFSGLLVLWLALALAAYGIAAGLLEVRSGRPGWKAGARGAIWGQFAALTVAQADQRVHETHGWCG